MFGTLEPSLSFAMLSAKSVDFGSLYRASPSIVTGLAATLAYMHKGWDQHILHSNTSGANKSFALKLGFKYTRVYDTSLGKTYSTQSQTKSIPD